MFRGKYYEHPEYPAEHLDILNCGHSFQIFASGCSFPYAGMKSLLGSQDMNIIFHQ